LDRRDFYQKVDGLFIRAGFSVFTTAPVSVDFASAVFSPAITVSVAVAAGLVVSPFFIDRFVPAAVSAIGSPAGPFSLFAAACMTPGTGFLEALFAP